MEIQIVKKKIKSAYRRWSSYQARSLQLINQIMSVLSKMSLVERENLYSDSLLSFDSLQDRLSYKLIKKLNSLIPNLYVIINEFDKIVYELQIMEKNFKEDVTSAFKSNNYWSTEDLTMIEEAEKSVSEIVNMFSTELALRKQILTELDGTTDFNIPKFNLYMTLWTTEIYIEREKIFYLLDEFSEIERILETGYANSSMSQLGINPSKF